MSDWYELTEEQEQILADVLYEEARENSEEEDFKKMSWFGKSLQEPTEEETQNAHRYKE